MAQRYFIFDTDDSEFDRGFAMGQVWGHLTCGEPLESRQFDVMGRTDNCENLLRISEALERELEITIHDGCDLEEMWVTFKAASDHQKVAHGGWDTTVAQAPEGLGVRLCLDTGYGPCHIPLSPEKARGLAEELLRIADGP